MEFLAAKKIPYDLLPLLLLPSVLLLISDSWIFTSPFQNWIDAWVYDTGWAPAYCDIKGLKSGLQETVAWFMNPENLRLYKSGEYNI